MSIKHLLSVSSRVKKEDWYHSCICAQWAGIWLSQLCSETEVGGETSCLVCSKVQKSTQLHLEKLLIHLSFLIRTQTEMLKWQLGDFLEVRCYYCRLLLPPPSPRSLVKSQPVVLFVYGLNQHYIMCVQWAAEGVKGGFLALDKANKLFLISSVCMLS